MFVQLTCTKATARTSIASRAFGLASPETKAKRTLRYNEVDK